MVNPDIIAADPGQRLHRHLVKPFGWCHRADFAHLPAGDSPIAVAVDEFRGNQANFDIAVLNANGKIIVFVNNIVPGTSVTPADFSLPDHSHCAECRLNDERRSQWQLELARFGCCDQQSQLQRQ